MDAYDADVLIYAAHPDHEFGPRIRRILAARSPVEPAAIGSVMLLPELLIKPSKLQLVEDVARLDRIIEQLELVPCDPKVAQMATALGARYRLGTIDAIHLATAVVRGADRFITNNRRDFRRDIAEVTVTYPEDLPEPAR